MSIVDFRQKSLRSKIRELEVKLEKMDYVMESYVKIFGDSPTEVKNLLENQKRALENRLNYFKDQLSED